MKKIILTMLCLLLSTNCFAKTDRGIITNKRLYIVQALDNGALGYICPKWALDTSDCREGQFVYFNFNFDFVDKQRVKIPKGYYLYANGVYKYITREDQSATVRKVDIYSNE